MPRRNVREPRTQGWERKDGKGIVVGRIRAVGKVTFFADDVPNRCSVSGRETLIKLKAGSFEIPCHTAFFGRGIKQLGKVIRSSSRA